MDFPYFMPPFVKTPQELEAEQRRMMEQYSRSYGNLVSRQSPNTYTKTDDFSIVKQAQPPDDGTPLVFLDEKNMFMHSKKYVNGVACIQSFRLVPCDFEVTSGKQGKPREIEGNFEERIARLEEVLRDEVKRDDGNHKTEKSEGI